MNLGDGVTVQKKKEFGEISLKFRYVNLGSTSYISKIERNRRKFQMMIIVGFTSMLIWASNRTSSFVIFYHMHETCCETDVGRTLDSHFIVKQNHPE